MPSQATLYASKREIDLLEIGAWTSDALLKEGRHTESGSQFLGEIHQSTITLAATCEEKNVTSAKQSLGENQQSTITLAATCQEKNLTSAKHRRAIEEESTLVSEGKIVEEWTIDDGLFGSWLLNKLASIQQGMMPHLESGLLACEEVLAKVRDSGNMDYILDMVTQLSFTGYESGLSEGMT